ncbi:MAG: hypothetical protein AAGK04_03910 [Planctomycetota bacterium]
MNGSDTIRIVTGVGVVAIAGAVIAVAVLRGQQPPPIDASPSPGVITRAAQQGVDLTNQSPGLDRERLLGVFESGQTVPFGGLEFRNGAYFDADDRALTGYLSDTHDNGSPRLIACVVDGVLQGPSLELHPSGTLKASRSHKDGEPVGQILERYRDGSLKLRAMCHEPAASGGTTLREITVGEFDDGTIRTRQLGTGRLQFVVDGGRTTGRNAETPLHEVEGYMLFYDRIIGGQKLYTSNSASITAPESGDETSTNAGE